MALQGSGKISLSEIAAEFGGSAPHSMSEYLRGGSNVPTILSGTASVAAPNGDTDNVVVANLNVKVKTVTAVGGSGFNLTADEFYDFTISKTTISYQNGTDVNDGRCSFPSGSSTATVTYTASNADSAILTNSTHSKGGTLPSTNGGVLGISSQDTDKTLTNTVTASSTLNQSALTTSTPCNSQRDPRTLQTNTTIRTTGLASTNNVINITSGSLTNGQAGNSLRYLWSNGTGGTITVEGTSVTTANQDIEADGTNNFSISYTDAQVNANIPNDGSGVKVSMTDFYLGRKT